MTQRFLHVERCDGNAIYFQDRKFLLKKIMFETAEKCRLSLSTVCACIATYHYNTIYS